MTARSTLEMIASMMYARAASCHAKGIAWVAQSARIDQFAAIGSDEETELFLRMLVQAGMVQVVEGIPVLVETATPEAKVDIRITSAGGES